MSCVAHARRKFGELAKAGTKALAEEAIRRFARIYELEGEFANSPRWATPSARRREELANPLWASL